MIARRDGIFAHFESIILELVNGFGYEGISKLGIRIKGEIFLKENKKEWKVRLEKLVHRVGEISHVSLIVFQTSLIAVGVYLIFFSL